MKYTIELTNKQKKQMDLMCELFHRYVGFNPKLEMDIPIPMTVSPAYKKGFEDGKKQAIEEIPELANKENEIYNDGYNKALEDVNHAINVLKDMTVAECKEWFGGRIGIDDVVCTITIQNIIGRTKAYEEKKKADEESIKVGDEVVITGLKDQETIGVITMLANNNYTVICLINGSEMARVTKNNIKPTGKHFDEVSQLLDKLKGEK